MSLLLSDENWSTLKGEVFAKFEEIFDLESQAAKDKFKKRLEDADEDEIFEELQGVYFSSIVTADWVPTMFTDADPDNAEITFVTREAMKKACVALCITPDILE